ncbi:MAG: hypothetical protein KIT87_15685 [Anaerolineae bacterium]|nr:hypothetical protein [Anaerolineae bacterium]
MKLRDFGAIILLGSIWGASYLFIKLGVAVMPPATFVLGRVVIAGLVSLAIMNAHPAAQHAGRLGHLRRHGPPQRRDSL